MSTIADQTEKKALVIIARMIKQFDKLQYLNMDWCDDQDATEARNLLTKVVESNGYKVNHDPTIRRSIIKLKHDKAL